MYEDFMRVFAEDVYNGYGDTDHPICPQCGCIMNFHGGRRKIGNGYWDCDGCDFRFTENELNSYLD